MRNTLLIAIMLTAGCANYRPLIDTRGVDMSGYEANLAECQAYARSENPAASAAGGLVTGAAIGAAIGAIAGAFVGAADSGAAMGAALGGAQGVVAGGAGSAETQKEIIQRCLSGRGYSVLR